VGTNGVDIYNIIYIVNISMCFLKSAQTGNAVKTLKV